jgi:hypothetical protein
MNASNTWNKSAKRSQRHSCWPLKKCGGLDPRFIPCLPQGQPSITRSYKSPDHAPEGKACTSTLWTFQSHLGIPHQLKTRITTFDENTSGVPQLSLKPYVETTQHGPNFTRPPPEVIEGEEGHYEIEQILASCPTRNRKSTQYLVKWKGYPNSENSWLPAKELTHAKDLLAQFRSKEGIPTLQVQQEPKEGILSRAKLVTTQT